MTQPFFLYWGKAKPADGSSAAFHLLPYHCLDVAAVGVTYLQSAQGVRRWLQRELRLDDERALLDWVAFWLALHDVGKFSEAFQSQCDEVFRALRGRAPSPTKPYRVRHDTLGMAAWCDVISRQASTEMWLGPATEDFLDGVDAWARAVTGHHGQPPEAGHYWGQHFDEQQDGHAIRAFVTSARELLLPETSLHQWRALDPAELGRTSQRLSWWIAGLAVLADWVGSNTNYFGYVANPDSSTPLRDYWEQALVQATKALNATGVLPAARVPNQPLASLFPGIVEPSPLQRWASETPISAEPQIYLLEDVTGAGKTEAAVTLAHRVIAAGAADGFFVGLPTMATANAMYKRIADVFTRLFGSDASLVLAHGQKNLVEAFAASVLRPGPQENDRRQSDDTATARCAAWLADNNKRALLASAGVGTLDQALLAVLHSRHQSLRLLGLFRKVLIVDEVHACDHYMQRLLETLLEFHASAGGSAILLSATLPATMKQVLLRAYARGRGVRAVSLAGASSYPLTTTWNAGTQGGPIEMALESRPDVCRDVAVRYVSDTSEVIAHVEAMLAAGRCVCWIRNTVFDAVDAFNSFKDRIPLDRLTLFHARFALHDRLRTEEHILDHFGAQSGPEQRRGRLVVATQVAEQSLDADWDVVISDLAPIDRLIQRAGRLQRHVRDAAGTPVRDRGRRDERGEPWFWVHGPAWTDSPAASWFSEKFPKAAAVYAHHGQVWLSARLLQDGRIAMPGDARRMIEGVFGDDADFPSSLQANADRSQAKGYADIAVAQQNSVKLASGYLREGIDWWSEAKTPSRLGEASTTVVLARWQGERLRPLIDRWSNEHHGWAYSSLRISERLIARRREGATSTREAAIRTAEESLPGKGKWSVLLPLEQTAEDLVGTALTADDDKRGERILSWRYDSIIGLQQVPQSEAVPTTPEYSE